ncbi:winged helix-turn-helix domain-containing protein [Vibrio diabolicus]|uniref:winged helix-turn-helix domain-containing protein n=1 Tax=Vibrio diabolicus TaxID=50719 RepID=UPI00249515E1|nr:winged helix-turn-helix domain-containing protein [Vibrio diabolicus]
MFESTLSSAPKTAASDNGLNNEYELVLDKHSHTVMINRPPDKKLVQLTSVQFELLRTLTQYQDQVLSKSFLYETVLKRTFSEHDRALDMHISRIRKRLVSEGINADRIQTVHRQGYVFKHSKK